MASLTTARSAFRFNGGAQAGHNVLTADGRHHTSDGGYLRRLLRAGPVVSGGGAGRPAGRVARLPPIHHLDVAGRYPLRLCRAYLADGRLVTRITPGPERDLRSQAELTRTLLRARPVYDDPAGPGRD